MWDEYEGYLFGHKNIVIPLFEFVENTTEINKNFTSVP